MGQATWPAADNGREGRQARPLHAQLRINADKRTNGQVKAIPRLPAWRRAQRAALPGLKKLRVYMKTFPKSSSRTKPASVHQATVVPFNE